MKKLQTVLVLFLGMAGMLAQDVAVTGTVTDDEGNPLEGASVYVSEISVGTSTDANGNYELLLKEGKHMLRFSYIGFAPVARSIILGPEGMTIDVSLQASLLLDEVVIISGSKKPEKITNSPATVVTISPRQIAEYAGNPAELLAREKGIDYFRAGIAVPAFNIRGFNSNFNSKNLQVTDGRNSSLIATGLPMGPLTTTIKEDIEQIEVVLGPNATLYGPNAHNGLINTITKDPRIYEGTTIATNLGVNSDGNGYYSARLRFAKKFSDKWAFKATGEYTKATEFIYADSVYIDRNADGIKEGYPEYDLDNDVEFFKTEASAYFSPTEGTDFIATYGHSNSTYLSPTNVGRNQIIDWRINLWQLRFNTRNFFAQAYFTNSKTDDTYSIDERTKQYYRGIDSGLTEEEASGEYSYASAAKFIDDSKRFNAEVQYSNTLFDDKLELVTGLQWQLDKANSHGTYLLDEDEDDYIDVAQIGGYVHLDYNFGHGYRGIAAARIDNHEIYGTNFIPKLGLLKAFDKGTLRLTYGQGIAAPTILNLYGDLFSGLILGNAEGFTLTDGSMVESQGVEKVDTYEIGYRGSLSSRLYGDFNAYYNINKDFLSPVTVIGVATHRGDTPIEEVQSGYAFYNGLVATYINFGKVNTYGADFALTYSISPKWNLTANYSYFDYSFDEDNMDNDFNNDGEVNFLDFLINSPTHKFGAGVNHNGEKFFASLFSRWVEEYNYFSSYQIASETLPDYTYRGSPIIEDAPSTDSYNYGPLGGFVTFDLNFGYHFSDSFTLSFAATNLFNTEMREFTASPPTGGLYVLEAKFNLD
ncbi:TonB-dependent receptor [Maribacter polysaccharolyticus]|uniref:TonB-dependent receptor n=1 Tax=Maribacter polysaccharolyticus TaxID=3020831 RepID=UPI00237FA025|nr:TonB-dependent receptor [Maribacter polysaccharolyticus]MDE3742520.1 TonB-dependent receptor [Maribacter polysaccharolyticus]